MKADERWQTRVRDAANLVLAPLITDGAVFDYADLDYDSRSLSVKYSLNACEACAISNEDLTAILDEGISRALGGRVTVSMIESR